MGTKHSKFAADTKLSNGMGKPQGRDTLKRHLDWLEWQQNGAKFNKDKCCHDISKQLSSAHLWLQRSPAEGDLEDKYASCELLQKQCYVRSWAVSTGAFLGEVETRASHWQLYSALVRLHLWCCAQLRPPQFKNNTDWRGSKGSPWRWSKENLPYKKRVKKLEAFPPGEEKA